MLNKVKNHLFRYLYNQLEIVRLQQTAYRNSQIRKHLKHCGKDVRFNGNFYMTGENNIVIGDNVHIGDNAFIRGEAGLEIGDNTHISRNLVLYTISHEFYGERLPYDDQFRKKPVHIGKNVWIGMNVCIVPGAYIGDGVIVGMGAVVVGEVPPLAIVGAAPGQIIAQRDEKHYATLVAQGAYGGVNGRSLDLE